LTVAIVMTVRDEQELLRSNLLYHRFIGVDHAYVYDDGSTDGTPATIADLDFVTFKSTVPREQFRDRGDLAQFVANYNTHLTARQLLNVVDAMAAARSAGSQWLAHIDADELLAADIHAQRPAALRDFFDGQEKATQAVVFRPLEVVQRRLSYDDVFTEETLFKRGDASAKRKTYDPIHNKTEDVNIVYGHSVGKSAVRLAAGPAPMTVHRFAQTDGTPLVTKEAGRLLHYYCHSFEAFESKFHLMADHPDTHIRGDKVVLQKRLWRDVVNRAGYDDAALRDYYQRWVMFGPDEVARLSQATGWGPLRQPPVIVQVETVGQVLAQVQNRQP
jgi:Glycosyl transferase family 2